MIRKISLPIEIIQTCNRPVKRNGSFFCGGGLVGAGIGDRAGSGRTQIASCRVDMDMEVHTLRIFLAAVAAAGPSALSEWITRRELRVGGAGGKINLAGTLGTL